MSNINRDYSEERTLGLTSQQAVAAVGNRYDLVLIAAQRARELMQGSKPKLETRHGPILTALKEIEQGHVGRNYLYRDNSHDTKSNH